MKTEIYKKMMDETYTVSGELQGSTDTGVMLTTNWDQSGVLHVDINSGANKDKILYNQYCPEDADGNRTLTGCTNTAAASIIYYFIKEGDLDLELTLTNSDEYTEGDYTISSSGDSSIGTVSFSVINSKLSSFDVTSADDIAALTFACGVVQQADYGTNETGTAWDTSLFYRAGFSCANEARLYYNDYGYASNALYWGNQGAISDGGFEVLIENLTAGRVVGTSYPGHALVIDGYRNTKGYDEFHINFGWGGSANNWFTREYLNDNKGGYDEFFYDLYTEDAPVNLTVNDKDLYGTGTAVRAFELAAGITGRNTITFSDSVAGTQLKLLNYLQLREETTVNNFNMSFCSGDATEVWGFYADVDSATVFESFTGDIVVSAQEYSAAIQTESTLTLEADNAIICAANYAVSSDYSSGAETILKNLKSQQNKSGKVTFNYGSTTGIAFYCSEKDDTITLDNRSIVVGHVYLEAGNNTLTISNDSHLLGDLWAEGKTTITIDNSSSITGDLLLTGEVNLKFCLSGAVNSSAIIKGYTSNSISVTADISQARAGEYILQESEYKPGFAVTVSLGSTKEILEIGEKGSLAELTYQSDKLVLKVFEHDKIPPTVPAGLIVLSIDGNQVELDWNDSTDNVELSSYEYRYKKSDAANFGTPIKTKDSDIMLSGLQDGLYVFQVRAQDRAGNVSEWSEITFLIDTVPPEKPVATADITTLTNKSVTVTATFSEDSVTKEYSLNGSTWKTYPEGGIVFEENGTVYFRAIDASENISEITVFVVNNIDSSMPDKPVVAADITDPTNKDVTVTADFGEAAIKEYSLDGKTWSAYNGGIIFEANGTVYFRCAKFEGGTFSETVSYEVTNIDKTAPEGQLSASYTVVDGVPQFAFSFTEVTEKESGLATFTLEYATDPEFSVIEGSETVDYTADTFSISLDLPENTFYFRVIFTDKAGNTSKYSNTVELTIDLTAPESPVASADITGPTNKDVTVTAVFSEDSVTKEYSFDGETWDTYTEGILFKENGSVYFRGTDSVGNISEVTLFKVDNIDTSAPDQPTATADITGPTNKDVTVTAVFSEDSVTKEYSFDGETWDTYTEGILFKENGSVYFRGTDSVGNISGVTLFEVKNIDKTAPDQPTATADITGPTNTDVTVTAVFSKDSVVQEYSFDGEEWFTYTVGILFKENGSVYFRGTDEAGNISEKTLFTVDNIDKNAPDQPSATADITGPTNKDVTVTAEFSEDSVTKEYSFDGEEWFTYTVGILFKENGSVYFRGTDKAGNLSEKTLFKVDNIDKTAPDQPTATADITGPTNKDVTVTAVFSEDSVTKEYSFDGEKWVTYTKGILFKENGSVYFRGTDSVGNISGVTLFEVKNIDKTAPDQPTAAADITGPTNKDVTVTAVFSEDSVTKEYSFDGENWVAYTSGILFEENGSVSFRGIDDAGNISGTSLFTVGNIDKQLPDLPQTFSIEFDNNAVISWQAPADNGNSGIKGYFFRYGTSTELAGDGEFLSEAQVTVTEFYSPELFYQIRSVDNAGNISDWSEVMKTDIPAAAPRNVIGTAKKLSWDKVFGVSNYVVELSTDNFASVVRFETSSNAIDALALPKGSYSWRVAPAGSELFTQCSNVYSNYDPQTSVKLISDNDGDKDLFAANAKGVWENEYMAEHNGILNSWSGTKERVALGGKNLITDIFRGADDANVLILTDDANGDALFVEDIYTSFGNDAARITQIDEIRAGAGADVIDLTSQKFAYKGDGVTVYGGSGHDTIWANNGSNILFGDAGKDRIVGGSDDDVIIGGSGNDSMHGGGGKDIFTFCADWGVDTVEQLANGSITLWFESGSEENWNAETMTYTDGENSVTVTGCSDITLKFGNTSELNIKGAFDSEASKEIFEDKNKGFIA